MRRSLRAPLALLGLSLFAVRPAPAAPPLAVQQDPEQAIARRIFFAPSRTELGFDRVQALADRREIADRVVAEQRALLFGGEPITIEHTRTRHSASGTQVFYRQLHEGVPVEGSEFAVTLDRAGHPMSIWSRAQAGLHAQLGRPSLDAATALSRVDDSAARNRRVAPHSELVVLPQDGGRLAYRVDVALWSPYVDWVAYVDAQSGELIAKYDRMLHEKPVQAGFSLEPFDFETSSTPPASAAKVSGTGLVLPANPLNNHPERYALRDATADMDPFRESMSIDRLDGSGFLRGDYVDVFNTDNPRVAVPSLTYEYSVEVVNGRFHEVNAYWHIDTFQHYIRTTLGVIGANDTRQTVAVHQGEDDNSSYSPGTDSIRFGDGGVDDSEDGEVVIHEYGHAVHDAISGLSFSSTENQALSEGFGDFLASILGDNPYVMEWDATAYFQSIGNPFPYLRSLSTSLTYEQKTGQMHHDGQIIGGSWWTLHNALDAELADRLIIESFFHLPGDGGFRDFADATFQVDLALHGGAHWDAIYDAYNNRHIPITPLFLTTHEVPADSETAGGPFPVSVNVLSTRALSPTSPVRVFHRTNESDEFTELAMSSGGSGDWIADLPGPNSRQRLEYYFQFTDEWGGSDVLPAGAPSSFYSFEVGTSLAASGITHAGLADLPLEAWPPTLHARLLDATPDQRLFVRYQIGSLRGGDLELRDDGRGDFSVTLPRQDVEAGLIVQYELYAPTELGELVDGPHQFKLLAPTRVLLHQNAPNPFNPSTRISFLLPKPGRATLTIYDVAGRRVRTLLDDELSAGLHERDWNGRDDGGHAVASGVYLYRLVTPDGVRAKRMTLAQ